MSAKDSVTSHGYDYEDSDPSFIADLRKSKESVAVAAKWLSEKGYPVIVRPTFERPSVEQMDEYADDGDIEIVQRIEVKRRQQLTFTSREDFPYETVIVDACHCYDRARPKPYAYIIFNREMTAAFVMQEIKWVYLVQIRQHLMLAKAVVVDV